MKVGIVTDSTCDLPPRSLDAARIKIIPLHITQGERTFLDGVDLTREEFYDRLPDYSPAPQTAAPGPEPFEKAYTELARTGAEAVLSVHVSEKLSATIKSARMAAESFREIPVKVLDSGQLTMGLGFLVEAAARLSQLGGTLEEILEHLTELMKRTYVFATLETLEYLRRSGRMHFAVARLGEILQIKPLLHMHQGNPTAHRARTQRKANERILEWLREYSPYERLAIVHAGVPERAEALRVKATEYLPIEHIPIVQITPVLGAHLGIGALGVACVRRKQ